MLCLILTACMALLMTSCGDSDSFRIAGTVAGNRTMNLRLVFPGEDNINNVLTAARDGQFGFQGSAPEGTMIEISANDYRPIARLYVRNGEKIKLFINPDDPYACEVEGSPVSERWMEWIHENKALLKKNNAKDINDAIARYVESHKDDIVSTLLLITEYDASRNPAAAQKLMNSIAVEARPAHLIESWVDAVGRVAAGNTRINSLDYIDSRDSAVTFRPGKSRYSLLAFSNDGSGRRDSVVKAIAEIVKGRKNERQLNVVDYILESDTFTWRYNARRDSIKWNSAWVPGALANPSLDRLGIPSMPYFILVDSTGNQIMRAGSVTEIKQRIKTLKP